MAIIDKTQVDLEENLRIYSKIELQDKLKTAVAKEKYELAALCRNELQRRKNEIKRKLI